jgi:hypothetical protein
MKIDFISLTWEVEALSLYYERDIPSLAEIINPNLIFY